MRVHSRCASPPPGRPSQTALPACLSQANRLAPTGRIERKAAAGYSGTPRADHRPTSWPMSRPATAPPLATLRPTSCASGSGCTEQRAQAGADCASQLIARSIDPRWRFERRRTTQTINGMEPGAWRLSSTRAGGCRLRTERRLGDGGLPRWSGRCEEQASFQLLHRRALDALDDLLVGE